MYVTLSNFAPIGKTVAELWSFFKLQFLVKTKSAKQLQIIQRNYNRTFADRSDLIQLQAVRPMMHT